jgi:CelD/BcsL family acetyltransferase involved in cellulose biosynthesis
MYVRNFKSLAGLEQLKPAWGTLYSHCVNPTFYNDWRWHHALQKHLVKENINYFAVYEVEDDNVPIAIVPLTQMRRERFGLQVSYLTFPYHSDVDASDLLVHQGKTHIDILGSVLDYINKERIFRWDILSLSLFSDRSGCRAITAPARLQKMAEQGAYVRGDCPTNLVSLLSKKQIKNVNRLIKNAESTLGSVAFYQETNPTEIQTAYHKFLDIESAGWRGVEGSASAISLRPDAVAFYSELLASFVQSGQATINLLTLGDRPVAGQLALRDEKGLSLLKIGYDESLRDVGPGSVALLRCLEHETGRAKEICLVTNPTWAERWHFTVEDKWVLTQFNSSVSARILRLLQRVHSSFRK